MRGPELARRRSLTVACKSLSLRGLHAYAIAECARRSGSVRRGRPLPLVSRRHVPRAAMAWLFSDTARRGAVLWCAPLDTDGDSDNGVTDVLGGLAASPRVTNVARQ